MTKEQQSRLEDLVNVKDMMPNLGNLREDVASALKEIERLRFTEKQYNQLIDDLRKTAVHQ